MADIIMLMLNMPLRKWDFFIVTFQFDHRGPSSLEEQGLRLNTDHKVHFSKFAIYRSAGIDPWWIPLSSSNQGAG